jgi:hypothetical protein
MRIWVRTTTGLSFAATGIGVDNPDPKVQARAILQNGALREREGGSFEMYPAHQIAVVVYSDENPAHAVFRSEA